jgi:SAM-dependent methyltransferase
MVRIPACLYLYRLHADGRNTYVQRNAEIRDRQQQVSNRYVYALIAEWCRRNGLPLLDLGDDGGCPPGFVRLDPDSATARARLAGRLPFADGAVGCVRAYDVLERVPRCADAACDHGGGDAPATCVTGLMNEIYRVLAPGGWLLARVPVAGVDGSAAPGTASAWTRDSFGVYTRRELAQEVPGARWRFQSPRLWQAHPTAWHRERDLAYVYADLVALKGQRQPGASDI